jgi:trehalose 2-sulfotransferase
LSYARWVLAPTLPEHPTEPTRSYLVCGAPRSGTWLLCGLLASTGVAGRPHEYFWAGTEKSARKAWDTTTFAEYVRAVLAAGTTRNGVFGAKVMWASMPDLIDRLRATNSARDRDVLKAVFPSPCFVWVRREDTVAQAVSWSRAIQTGHWHHWDPPATIEPRFDLAQIDALVEEIHAHDRSWRRWFADNGIDPLAVRFEELAADQDLVVRRVLATLEVELPKEAIVAAQTVKVDDSLNDEWTKRYRSLKGI